MKKFVHLLSSTNPIELDQVKFAFEKEGIEYNVIGESALAIGSVELTGIQGASIQVLEGKVIHANKVLSNIGINNMAEDDNFQKYFLIVVAVFAALAIGYLIYLGVS